jgi:hypothetical protein
VNHSLEGYRDALTRRIAELIAEGTVESLRKAQDVHDRRALTYPIGHVAESSAQLVAIWDKLEALGEKP